MDFKKFFRVITGVALIGISIGYTIGFYCGFFLKDEILFYIAVPIMAVGCFITIYITIGEK
tara:strand:+ start:111 stop:293 length:183 start_codon:yes stop_codon:yes gene_type:complete